MNKDLLDELSTIDYFKIDIKLVHSLLESYPQDMLTVTAELTLMEEPRQGLLFETHRLDDWRRRLAQHAAPVEDRAQQLGGEVLYTQGGSSWAQVVVRLRVPVEGIPALAKLPVVKEIRGYE